MVVGKYHRHLQSTPPTKSYGKGARAAFANELGYFNTGKHVSQMKNWKRATNPVNHQPKRHTVCQNISEEKHLDMDDSKLDLKICTESQQKNNFVEPKGLSHKLQTEDLTFGSSTKRWDHSKNHYERLNTGNENKEVVFFNDEDTKPAKSVDVKVANKRQIGISEQMILSRGKEKVTIKKEREGGIEKEAREHRAYHQIYIEEDAEATL